MAEGDGVDEGYTAPVNLRVTVTNITPVRHGFFPPGEDRVVDVVYLSAADE